MTKLDGYSGIQLSWQNIIMTVGLVIVMVGGFWTLAYIPIQDNIKDLKQQLTALREIDTKHFSDDDAKFLTQKEHNEFKSNIEKTNDRISKDMSDTRREVETRRSEAATRQDVQNALNTTRVEFLAEIKRLDQATSGILTRNEFSAWKSERDKTIEAIQSRQNRFSEALDAMYARIMNQAPSYPNYQDKK